MNKAEAELKYAAQNALGWMLGAQQMKEIKSWIDPVTIDMLRIAISHSTVEPVIPEYPKGNN